MNETELNRLTEKYYQGESTEDDEKALKAFFSQDNIPESYETEQTIFGYYMASAEIPEPAPDFETRILERIDKSDSKIRYKRLRKYILPSISVAAGLLILAGSYFFFINRNEPLDTFSDPDLAYDETLKILMDVSSQLNQGTRALEPVRRINELTTKSFISIYKSTRIVEKNLDLLQKAIETVSEPVEQNIHK